MQPLLCQDASNTFIFGQSWDQAAQSQYSTCECNPFYVCLIKTTQYLHHNNFSYNWLS